MRNLIIFFFFSFIATSQSQSINNGLYASPSPKVNYWQNFFFNFKDSNTFKYISFGWEGNGFGVGKYEVKNDSIYLKFENCPLYDKERYLERIEGQSDSLKIDLKIQYESDLAAVPCTVVESGEILSPDANGNLKRTVSKNGKDLTLLFSFIGLDSIVIKIKKDIAALNGTIIFDNYWIYPANEKMSFKITKTNKDFFKLRMADKNVKLTKMLEEDVLKTLRRLNSNDKYDCFIKYFL